jgi:SAM-dependent methyltransferase/uncharacterized protein YbaR (Trm112 family)
MKRWFVRTTREERAFEKKGILALTDKYLATDVIEKVSRDDGYRAKVDLLEHKVGKCDGYLLDIGSNTAGECEYMVSRGYTIIATDINEYALSISKKRCAQFSRKAPAYVACDGISLPFESESMACVVFNESLHHLPEPLASLKEAWRVLAPGGRVLMFEPYAYDPWRRISEVRDYYRGTIETSFSEGQIKRMLRESGFILHEMSRPVLPPSQYKLDALPTYRRLLRTGYFWARRSVPSILGMILCQGRKQGEMSPSLAVRNIDDILICPVSGSRLVRTDDGYASTGRDNPLLYPTLDGIPVLIADDARPLHADLAAVPPAFQNSNVPP